MRVNYAEGPQQKANAVNNLLSSRRVLSAKLVLNLRSRQNAKNHAEGMFPLRWFSVCDGNSHTKNSIL